MRLKNFMKWLNITIAVTLISILVFEFGCVSPLKSNYEQSVELLRQFQEILQHQFFNTAMGMLLGAFLVPLGAYIAFFIIGETSIPVKRQAKAVFFVLIAPPFLLSLYMESGGYQAWFA